VGLGFVAERHRAALQAFVNRYKNHQRRAATGLYFWNDDTAIGVD
jgi:putative isomerase